MIQIEIAVIQTSTVLSAHYSHVFMTHLVERLEYLSSFAADNSYHETHGDGDGPDVTAVIQ